MGSFVKSFLKRILVLLVVIFVALTYVFFDYLSFKDRSVPVLMYHGVGTEDPKNWGDMLITPQLFEKQLQYLQSHDYKVVSVEELSERFRTNQEVKNCVAVTFDDGYVNNYLCAFPLLQKYNATATFYVIKNAIGTSNYMNEKQIEQMLKAGMKIGSHTMTHRNLTEIDPGELQRELAGSKMLLGQLFEDLVVESISYPNGAYNDEVIAASVAAGYQEGVGGEQGVNTHDTYNDNNFALYRTGVYDRGDGVNGFVKTLEKAYFIGYMREKGINLAEIRAFFRK